MPKGIYERTPQILEAIRLGVEKRAKLGSENPNWRGGKSTHPLYEIYNEMVRRCHYPQHKRFKDYGARGIVVTQAWRESFWVFVQDVGPRPEGISPTGRAVFSLDRIDNEGNYEPGNVRWASPSEQARNKRSFGDGETRRDLITGKYAQRKA